MSGAGVLGSHRQGCAERYRPMSERSAHDAIAGLVKAVERGDRAALDELLPLVYGELVVLARQQRRAWRGDLTLDTTALVHEAYLKIVAQARVPFNSRVHFFAVASKAMRHILCNHARDRLRQKRGGGAPHVRLAPGQDVVQVPMSDEQSDMLAALDEALEALQRFAARQARVVECRFFGGMSIEDTAAALDISPRTVKRDWTVARTWLRREMQLRLDERS
jgi:RNA polymerase sigma factor (TIGR02999 family)